VANSPLRLLTDDDQPRMVVANQLAKQETEQALRGDSSQFQRGWRSGLTGISAGAFASDAISGEQSGDPNWQADRDLALRMAQEASQVGPRVSSLRDVHGVGDALDWAGGSLGQGLATMAPVAAAALATRAHPTLGKALSKAAPHAGAYVPAYMMERDEAVLGQYADPALAATDVGDRANAAHVKGGINAALESIVPAGLAGSILRKPTSSFLGAVGRNALTEGATEGAQQGVGFLAEKALDPGRQLDPMDLIDATAAGALTGGAVSGAGRAPSHALGAVGDALSRQAEAAAGPTPEAPPPGPVDLGPDGGGEPGFTEGMQDGFNAVRDRVKPFYENAKQAVDDAVSRATDVLENGGGFQDVAAAVFNTPLGDQAREDSIPDNESPEILGAADPAAAMSERDAGRQQRAAQYAEALLNDPKTPDMVRQRIEGMDKSFSSDADRLFVSSTYGAMQLGEKVKSAATDFVNFSKELMKGKKFNLQDVDTDDAAMTPLVNLLAQKLGPDQAGEAPTIARQLVSAASRIGSDMRIDEATDTRLRAISSAVGDDVLDAVSEAAGSDALRNSLAKIRAIPSASQDIQSSGGKSFLESMIQAPLTPSQTRQLASLVDTTAVGFANQTEQRQKNMLKILGTSAFGSEERARIVLDYYGNMRRRAYEAKTSVDEGREVSSDETGLDAPEQPSADDTYEGVETAGEFGSLTDREAPLQDAYFADPKTMQPFYHGREGSLRIRDGMRSRGKDVNVAVDTLRGQGVQAYPQSMRDYVREKGGNALEEVARLRSMLERNIKAAAPRANEKPEFAKAREQNRMYLEEQKLALELINDTDGAEAALDLFRVARTKSERDETAASDEVLSKSDVLLKSTVDPKKPPKGMNRYQAEKHNEKIDKTKLSFLKKDGKTLTVSAESLWKAWEAQNRSAGKGKRADQRMHEMFRDAVAAVFKRPDIAGLKTDLEDVLIDRESNTYAQRRLNPEVEAKKKELRAEYKEQRDAARAAVAERAEKADALLDEEGGTQDSVRQLESWAGTLTTRANKARLEARRMREEAKTFRWIDGAPDAEAVELRARASLVSEIADIYSSGAENLRSEAFAVKVDERLTTEAPKEGIRYTDETTGEALNRKPEARAPKATGLGAKLDAVLLANPELLTVLDGFGRPKDSSMSESRMHEAIYGAYSKLQTTPLKARLEALRKQYKAAGSPQEAKAIQYVGELIKSVLAKREEANSAKYSTIGDSTGQPGMDRKTRAAVAKEIHRLRGKDVKIRISRLIKDLGYSGASFDKEMPDGTVQRWIEIALDAKDPMSVAWHESLHDFFRILGEDRTGRSIKRDLTNAANAPHVKRQLEKLLAAHPKALEQIKNDPEERIAYMYQFWAAGELNIGPTGTNIFQKLRQFFFDMFKIATSDQRAEDILTAFHEGKFADERVVAEVLADLPRDTVRNRIERFSPALSDFLHATAQIAPDRLRDFQNEEISALADKLEQLVRRRFQQQGVWENKLADILAGTTAVERRTAVENMQARKDPSSPLEKKLAEFYKGMYDYMSKSGVETYSTKDKKWMPLRQVGDYFPRSWDPAAIQKDPQGFIALLAKHGNMSPAASKKLIDAIVAGDGRLELAEDEHSLGFTPFAKAAIDRQLTFINKANAADFAKYQQKDLMDITSTYIRQAVHRAEYAKLFENDGSGLAKHIEASGITDKKDLEAIDNSIRAMEGTLNQDKLSLGTKNLMSGAMTLQNITLLPLAIFSQSIDPIVMAARTGDLKDAGNAYVTALKRLRNFVGKSKDKVPGEELAEMLGIISQDSVLEAMGYAYGSTYMNRPLTKINRTFFKWNGMQGWNNSMRIAAAVAGEKYLLANRNNAKALEELGLEPSDIQVLQAYNNGVRGEGLDYSNPKIREAMYQFVDQAVLRPSAANRPVWMSDPRFQLVAHLKQFTFAMHNVVLKRATQQADEGNHVPWAILGLTVPVILAADMAKFALTGTTPANWGFMDYLVHSVERSGILGLGDFSVQATRGMDSGAAPGEGLLGPTLENLFKILRWAGGDPRVKFEDVLDRTVPGAKFV